MPKRGVNVHENEVMRAFKTVNDSYIEPISFLVPRRAEVFQDDIFPPVVGLKPAMSSTEWFDGKEALPPKIDLASVYAGEEPAEVAPVPKPSSQPPASTKVQSPTKNEPEPVKEAPQPSPAFRGPPPSMKEQTKSVAELATKFADKDDIDSSDGDDDTSSFEEVSKPVDRSAGGVPLAPPQAQEMAPPELRNAAESVPRSPVEPSQQKSTASPMKNTPSSSATSQVSTAQPQVSSLQCMLSTLVCHTNHSNSPRRSSQPVQRRALPLRFRRHRRLPPGSPFRDTSTKSSPFSSSRTRP